MSFTFCNFKSYRFRFAVFSLLVLALPVAAFDKSDLAMVSKRTVFYERLPYAVGVSGKIEDTKVKPGTTELTIYYVSANCYDPIFSIQIGFPADVEKTQEAVTFRHDTASLRLSADGIRYTVDRVFTSEASSSGPLMRVMPDAIRFDDATAFSRREGKITSQRVQPYALTPLSDSPLLQQAERFFSDTKQFEPDTVIRTQEGLWTCWRFDLKSEGVSSFLDPKGARLMLGSGKTLMFYNAANKIKAGGKINLTMNFRVQPDEAFPVPEQPAASPSMLDTHVHITATTDLRDSILMARRHGFQYWTLSILFNEQPYGRLFTGNEHMFEMMRRAPDVFLGFGLLQLEENGYPGFPRPGPDKPEHIQLMWEQGCVGLKTLVKFSKHYVQVDNPKYDSLWGKAAELHMPIVFHTEAEDAGSSHTRVAAVARRFPGSPYILAHLWDAQIDTTVKELKATPNLFIQHMHLTSRKAADGKTALERLIAEGLADRILFGSDVTNDHSPLIADQFQFIARLRELKVPEATIDRIMFASAHGMVERVVKRPGSCGEVAK